ncbi:hypothetical protein EDD21DRAFT_357079 [Dissophora ornata]|nr:hypothetical protein EDD21DRAFT_357079 [Dissophora ornata]
MDSGLKDATLTVYLLVSIEPGGSAERTVTKFLKKDHCKSVKTVVALDAGKRSNREINLADRRLDGVRVQHKWSVNQLIKFCRQQSEGWRMSKGKGKDKAKNDAGSAGAGENLAGANNDEYDA